MRPIRLFHLALALFACTSLVSATNLGVAANYDVLTFGNFTGNADAQGRLAIGGNANLTGFGLGASLPSADPLYPYTLVVGGNLTYTNGNVIDGGIAVGGTGNITSVSINGNVSDVGALTTTNGQINGTVSAGSWTNHNTGGPSSKTGTPTAISSVVDFFGLQSALTNDSVYWGGLGQTGTVNSANSQLTLTGNSSGVNIFDITSAQLSNATGGLTITAPSGSTVLVNVSGSSASFPNTGFSINGVSYQNVIFNFSTATTLSGSGAVWGSILAPKASFTFNTGQVNGNVIVSSMTGGGETHYAPFEGNLPTVAPEPGSLVLMSSGALGLLAVLRRRRRRSA